MDDFQKIIEEKKTFDRKQKRINAIVIILSMITIFVVSFLINQLVEQKKEINKQYKELNAYKDSILRVHAFKDSLLGVLKIINPTNAAERQRLRELVNRFEKADYSVTLVSFGYSASDYGKLWVAIAEIGFTTHVYVVPDQRRPSWVASDPTVFYYNDNNLKIAQDLADTLRQITNDDFEVQKGGGYSVTDEQKENSIIVHYVNNALIPKRVEL